jgi:LysR family hca operon transcriptional activator
MPGVATELTETGTKMNANIELRHLRYFMAVAEELNLTRAAERLHTVQPSLGHQIRQLEEFIGVRLFHRDGRRLALTEAGRTLLIDSRKMLQEFDIMLERVRCAGQTEADELNVGFYHGAEWRIFPQLLPFIRSQCPRLELRLRNMNPAEQVEALRNRTIDVGLLRGPLSEPEITTELILSDKIHAIIQARHPLAKLKRVSLQQLADLPFVTISRGVAPVYERMMVSLAAEAGVQFRTVLETDNILTSLITVGAVGGVTLAPAYVGQILPKTVVARQLAITPTPTTDLLVAYHSGTTKPLLTLFLAQVHDCFREEQKQRK